MSEIKVLFGAHTGCAREFIHAPSVYVAIINGFKTCTHRVHTSENRAPGPENVCTGRRVHP